MGQNRKTHWSRLLRRFHYWLSLAVALPFLIVIASGLILQLKKEIDWIQPPTRKGSSDTPTIGLQAILRAVETVPEAGVRSWADVDRLDLQPAKGIVKVQAKNRWEIQVDTATGEVLQARIRRSDLIESIHDGSFFHPSAKLLLFLPSGLLVFAMWATGMYLFLLPISRKRKKRENAVDF